MTRPWGRDFFVPKQLGRTSDLGLVSPYLRRWCADVRDYPLPCVGVVTQSDTQGA